jgi:hypothetical protein
MTDAYADFVAGKSAIVDAVPIPMLSSMNDRLFPHQRDLVTWAMRRGRAAIFADTGLGKTAMMVEWARHAAVHGRVLILAPLAVAEQTVREAKLFGVDVAYRRADAGDQITVTNYEMMHMFDPSLFIGVVLDESSILKSQDGKTRTRIIESFRGTKWRLACTATPAPNDYTELGNHSEFLGVKSHVEMLAEYFVHDGGDTSSWRLKGHAEELFWRWVCSWGAVVKRPSDIGHDDGAYNLPPIAMHDHVIDVDQSAAREMGLLFLDDARTLSEQRATRRATMAARVAKAAEIANGITGPVVVWCELNDEADACERAIGGAVQVAGADSVDEKCARLVGFADGVHRVMVTKPSVAGHGLNWQHCATMIFVGVSHSYEQTYQAIRRCWRFGQNRTVDVHIIRASTEGAIVENIRRKSADADILAGEMVARVGAMIKSEIHSARREWNEFNPTTKMVIPSWIKTEELQP